MFLSRFLEMHGRFKWEDSHTWQARAWHCSPYVHFVPYLGIMWLESLAYDKLLYMPVVQILSDLKKAKLRPFLCRTRFSRLYLSGVDVWPDKTCASKMIVLISFWSNIGHRLNQADRGRSMIEYIGSANPETVVNTWSGMRTGACLLEDFLYCTQEPYLPTTNHAFR